MARNGGWSGGGGIALGMVALAACRPPRAAVPATAPVAGPLVAAADAAAPRTAALGQPPAVVTLQSPRAADVVGIARDAMAKYALKAVIVRVIVDGQGVVTEALGESM